MKKLAFVINVFREDGFRSGGEKLFYELVNRSIQDGHQVDLYCTTYLSEKNILKPRLNKLTLLGHPKDFKYPGKIKAFYDKVKSLTEKENYDFILSENISPPIDVGILQGHSLIHYRDKAGNLFSKLLYSLAKSKHIKAQKQWLREPYRKIIVPSRVLKEELVRNFGVPEEKFLVMHPGVDLPEETPHRNTDKPFTFGLSAPGFSKKGGYVFLKALKILDNRGYEFKARVICPKFRKNPWLQFLVNQSGLGQKIEFIPYQQDMGEFYSSVDCVVMPSVMETFGLVALEAMIRAKPAIVSSFCGVSEIISDNRNGFIFDMTAKNHKNLAEKMEFLLNNNAEYEKISQNAYDTALNYSWENFYKGFKEELTKI